MFWSLLFLFCPFVSVNFNFKAFWIRWNAKGGNFFRSLVRKYPCLPLSEHWGFFFCNTNRYPKVPKSVRIFTCQEAYLHNELCVCVCVSVHYENDLTFLRWYWNAKVIFLGLGPAITYSIQPYTTIITWGNAHLSWDSSGVLKVHNGICCYSHVSLASSFWTVFSYDVRGHQRMV